MTKEELACLLNGREYGNEISPDEEKLAKESGLIAIFGYSDDGVIFAGEASDQYGGKEEKSFRLDRQGNGIEVIEMNVRNIGFINSLAGKESNMVHAVWCLRSWKLHGLLPLIFHMRHLILMKIVNYFVAALLLILKT